jgi:hypothetical protein
MALRSHCQQPPQINQISSKREVREEISGWRLESHCIQGDMPFHCWQLCEASMRNISKI